MIIKRFNLNILCYNYIYISARVMAKVARKTDGLKRRQTYEEVIYYIENDR